MQSVSPLKIAILLSLSIAAGCSSKGPATYNEYFSEARNNASKSGFKEHQDFNVPADKRPEESKPFTGIDDSLNLALAGATAQSGQIAANLSRSTTVWFSSMEILSSLLPKDVDYNALMGWMPASLAENEEQAAQKYKDLFYEAVVTTFPEEKGYKIEKHLVEDRPDFIGAHIINVEAGCPELFVGKLENLCFIRAFVKTPELKLTPGAHVNDSRIARHTEEYSYNLAYTPAKMWAHSIKHSYDVFMAPESDINFLVATQALSYNLPEWMVLHVGHRGKKKIDGKALPYAMQFRKGQPLYFMKPLPKKKQKSKPE